MRKHLLAEVARRGVITRAEALSLVGEHILDDAVAAGALVRIFPEVFALAEMADDVVTRRQGAQTYRKDGAISHTDALHAYSLPTCLGSRVHVTVAGDAPSSEWPALQLHRRRWFQPTAPHLIVRNGLRVVRIEQAIVESWPLLPEVDRRAPAIVATRQRRTTGARLLSTLARQPRTAGATQMRHVFELAAAGCQSPLEMWGHERVFSDRRLPPSRCQVPIDLPTGRIYLDRLFEAEMVIVELDGAAYHGEPGQRERDLRRDAALAARGYLVVRFSHLRLFSDPIGVVNELMAILATRRDQLGISAA